MAGHPHTPLPAPGCVSVLRAEFNCSNSSSLQGEERDGSCHVRDDLGYRCGHIADKNERWQRLAARSGSAVSRLSQTAPTGISQSPPTTDTSRGFISYFPEHFRALHQPYPSHQPYFTGGTRLFHPSRAVTEGAVPPRRVLSPGDIPRPSEGPRGARESSGNLRESREYRDGDVSFPLAAEGGTVRK